MRNEPGRPDRTVIIGAGHAGGSCAAFLRSYGYQGEILLIGEETLPPYQRPPLSKAWLKGEADAESLAVRPLSFYAENAITLRTGVRVSSIDRDASVVTTACGETIPYGRLVIATGSRPLRLPLEGHDLEGILELRTAADADRLKAAVAPGVRFCIVGGGYIGLETAAALRALGASPVIVERESRLLARVASPEISAFLEARHRAEGVALHLETTVSGFRGVNGRIAAVLLGDAPEIACDFAIVGVGAVPNDELASAAGLECRRGILVDDDARSVSDANIFAIGDVSLRPMPIYHRLFRLESVPNALEQAKQAASAICARPRPAPECPWQWSDQYDLKLQIAGYPFESDRRVVRGDPSSGRFAVFHLWGERLQAVEAVNAPDAFMFGRQVILNRARLEPALLADTAMSLKGVLTSS